LEINEIRDYISKQKFKVTDHAFGEMRADDLSFQDMVAGIMSGEIIEE